MRTLTHVAKVLGVVLICGLVGRPDVAAVAMLTPRAKMKKERKIPRRKPCV